MLGSIPRRSANLSEKGSSPDIANSISSLLFSVREIMNTKDTGLLGEHIAIVQLLELGLSVSRPLGDNDRYDLIIDKENILYRAQVKSSLGDANSVQFYLSSSQAHRGKSRTSYSIDEVDLFLLVDVSKNLVFILSNDGIRSSIIIRYTQSNSRNDNSNYASEFILTLDKI